MLDKSFLFDFFKNTYGYVNKTQILPPLPYIFDITYKCNLRCPYCYVCDHTSTNELTTQELLSVIDQLHPLAIVTLLGGEPLLRPDFLEIYEAMAKKIFSKVNVISNGALLTEKIADSFIKHKLLLLSVSLDGWRENHDSNRCKEGLFDTVTGNLEMLTSKRNHPPVEIKSIILENNLDDLPKLYKYCIQNNFDFFTLIFKRSCMLRQNASLCESLSPEFHEQYPLELYFDMEHFKEVHKELISLSKGAKTLLRWAPKFKPQGDIRHIEHIFANGDVPVTELYRPCLFPFSNVFINPQGDVYPCLSVKMGSVKEDKLNDIFNNSGYKNFRNQLKNAKLFNSCQMCCELVPKNL